MDVRVLRVSPRSGRRRGGSRDTSGFPAGKEAAVEETRRLRDRLEQLQELLYADHRRRVLLVLQGMDTAGKDGTIRRVFEGVNPQGVRVAQFGPPTDSERDHDFLWRIHAKLPGRGEIVIFNRSHYEDVLVVRVHRLVPAAVWTRRYDEINEFERTLVQEGTTILKVYLDIDRDEQRSRLAERLRDPTKQWKLRPSDLAERRHWSEYMRAYDEMLRKTSTPWAPWYRMPSDHRWYRDLAVSSLLVSTLDGMDLRYPKLLRELRGARVR